MCGVSQTLHEAHHSSPGPEGASTQSGESSLGPAPALFLLGAALAWYRLQFSTEHSWCSAAPGAVSEMIKRCRELLYC